MRPGNAPATLDRMTQEDAEAIAEWHYDPPFDFYDPRADDQDLAELLDPATRDGSYFTVRDSGGELVAFLQLDDRDGVVDVGIGLRPDLTGRGLGLSFLEHGLTFARELFGPRRFRLQVAEFNRRAITVYERAGFECTRSYPHETNGGVFRFVEMERPA